MDKLISMTDFVCQILDANFEFSEIKMLNTIQAYALFLKQPLTLGMFVPCDNDGEILKEPKKEDYTKEELEASYMGIDVLDYQEAKENVLFKGFTIRTENKKQFIGISGYEIELPLGKMTVEDLSNDWKHIELSESAIKQIGL